MPYTCKISGKEESILLIGERLSSRLADSLRDAGDAWGVRILAGLYSAELCECDVATLTGLPESEVVDRLQQYTDLGLLSHRKIHGMNYYRLSSGETRRVFTDALSPEK